MPHDRRSRSSGTGEDGPSLLRRCSMRLSTLPSEVARLTTRTSASTARARSAPPATRGALGRVVTVGDEAHVRAHVPSAVGGFRPSAPSLRHRKPKTRYAGPGRCRLVTMVQAGRGRRPGDRRGGLPAGDPAAYRRFRLLAPCPLLSRAAGRYPVLTAVVRAAAVGGRAAARRPARGYAPGASAADHAPARRPGRSQRPGLARDAGRGGTGCRGAAGPGAARAGAARAAR
jgi:hypothetical protein